MFTDMPAAMTTAVTTAMPTALLTDVFTDPAAIAIFAGVLGAFVGNFLTVLIHRIPLIMDAELAREHADLLVAAGQPPTDTETAPLGLLRPGARCCHCAAPLGLIDTLPLIGYLLRRGRCRHCGADIPLYMPLVEITTAALFVLAATRLGPGATLAAAWICIALLIVLAAIDARTRLLPDRLTLTGLWLGLAASVFGVSTDSRSAILGAIIGYAIPYLADRIFARLTGRKGMGPGDFKLTAMLGAWLGWQILPTLFFIAFGAGMVVAAALLITRRRTVHEALPFGPFLVIAGVLLLVGGPEVMPF